MAGPALKKPPLLKIADWPWWLERPYTILWAFIASLLLRLYFDLLWNSKRRLISDLILYAILFAAYALYRLAVRRRERAELLSEKLPAPICPTCGYDLRASLLRCPECGNNTPFKIWLDEHPQDKALYEKNRPGPTYSPNESAAHRDHAS